MESVYGCGAADFAKPEWGRYTRSGEYLYAHVLEQCVGHINLPGLRGGVKNGRVLASGAEAIICDFWNPGVQTFDSPDDIFFNFGSPTAVTFPLPDSRDTVVRFEMSSPEERQAMLEKHAADFAAATKRRPF